MNLRTVPTHYLVHLSRRWLGTHLDQNRHLNHHREAPGRGQVVGIRSASAHSLGTASQLHPLSILLALLNDPEEEKTLTVQVRSLPCRSAETGVDVITDIDLTSKVQCEWDDKVHYQRDELSGGREFISRIINQGHQAFNPWWWLFNDYGPQN